jgi:hypothetical protein
MTDALGQVNTTTCCLYTPVESRSADALGQTFSQHGEVVLTAADPGRKASFFHRTVTVPSLPQILHAVRLVGHADYVKPLLTTLRL